MPIRHKAVRIAPFEALLEQGAVHTYFRIFWILFDIATLDAPMI